ncbi:nitrate- and nitrite sensing domain-containing protein [Streptomyces sp. NPDC047081]|uniref:sensor histidine kinase n=1 Tax=Streptomyces sp. NPDC047081 TaxID=3154706 RepID=UPI0033C7E3D4
MAVHARASKRQSRTDGGGSRQLSLRTALLVLALVPCVALVALWSTTSVQLYSDWRTQKNRSDSAQQSSVKVAQVWYSLQEERRLSGAALAQPNTYRSQLAAQRERTDATAKLVLALPSTGWDGPADLDRDVAAVIKSLGKLESYREAVDRRTATQQQTYDDYTSLISADLKLFSTMSYLGMADVDYRIRPANDAIWGMEMVARENAIVTRATATGHLSDDERGQLAELVGSQDFIYSAKVLPNLPADQAARYDKLMSGSAWKQKTASEQAVLHGSASADGSVSASLAKKWSGAITQIAPQLQKFNQAYWLIINASIADELHSMQMKLIVTSALDAAAVVLVVVISLLLTRMLRRRIFALRQAALDLQTRMPSVVERMRRGEAVDPDAELPPIPHSDDELGQLGQALNLARHSALDTTMTQVGQFRGFEKLLQRIARRTQLLIGLQMKKLNELERRHEDPEVLEGLFDLDHLTARLRRYEENLVILGGGQPQRKWRKPVLMVDVLRSAQSEVQDYRRVQIEVEGRVWLAERAVGLVVHVLAELMENAVTFSKPPTPVEVYASRVGRGLAVEIEDRGMGMAPQEYDEANRLMADPPRMDVLSRAEDVRLGLYVVARLAQGLGLQVELRPSSFGGTRVVVLIPEELVLDDAAVEPAPEPVGVAAGAFGAAAGSADRVPPMPRTAPTAHIGAPATAPRPGSGRGALGGVRRIPGRTGTAPHLPDAPEPHLPSTEPLPKRVRMASLVDELRDPAADVRPAEAEERPTVRVGGPARSGATIGAFQRQSRIARQGAFAAHSALADRDITTERAAGPAEHRDGTADHRAGDRDRPGILPHRRRTSTED